VSGPPSRLPPNRMVTEMTDMAARAVGKEAKCDRSILTLLAEGSWDCFFVHVLLSDLAELNLTPTAWPARARLPSAFDDCS
jgi:hypothetical protein